MLGLMQDWPLTVEKVLDHAKANFPRREVVTRSVAGPITRSDYATIWANAKRVTNTLRARANLALSYQSAGRTGDAITIQQRVALLQEALLGAGRSRVSVLRAYFGPSLSNCSIFASS